MLSEEGNDITPFDDVLDIQDPRKELAAVEAQIEKIGAIMQRLVTKTYAIKSRINDAHSPFLRLLPLEIISVIFELCTPSRSLYPINPADYDRDSLPLKLGSVCSRWRKIAWTTPTLWASATLYLTQYNMNSHVSLLDEWLGRSGDLPLHISLYSDPSKCPDAPGVAINVIKKYASRWQFLHLQLPTSCYNCLPGPDCPLPHLTALHLEPIGWQVGCTVDMSHARLKVLSLSRVYLTSVSFRFDQVTHLNLDTFYVSECLEALSYCLQVVDCTLRNFIGDTDSLPANPILRPTLKHLELENTNDTSLHRLLDMILIPNIMALTYAGPHLLCIPNMCALISRSTSLQKFSLVKTIVPGEDIFLQLLTALKAVTEFVLEVPGINQNSPLTDRILRKMNPHIAADLEADCLLPSLEVFRYRGPQSFSLTESIATIRSRLPSSGPPPNSFGLSPPFPRPVNSWRVIEFDLTYNVPNSHQYIATQLQQISLDSPQVDIMFNLSDETWEE